MPRTKEYDLHAQFEVGYDEVPRIIAYHLDKDEAGYWECSGHSYDTYYFSEEETDMLISKFREANIGIEELHDLDWDEWFSAGDHYDQKIMETLPPTVLEWIKSLPEYKYNDRSEGK